MEETTLEQAKKVVENLLRLIFLPVIIIGGIIVIGSMLWDTIGSMIGLWDMGLLWIGIGLIAMIIIVVVFMSKKEQ